MKSTKTLGVALLVVLMAASMVLAGCTQTGSDATATPAQTAQATAQATAQVTAPVAEEPVEISYWAFWCANAVDGNYCESLIEEALNIDIKTVNISQSEADQVNLMLTSGEMPDCGWFGKNVDYMYYTNELTRTIPKSMVEEYVPGYTEIFSGNPVLEALVTTKEDASQYYGLPTFQANSAGHQYFYTDFYRKDWLDALGIEYPGNVEEVVDGVFMCDNGFTLEQHKAILEAFTKNDPDGNGQADTVGTIGAGSFISWTMLGSYGLCDGFAVEDEGKAVYYYSTERYKEILAYARDLYQEGLVDSEIFTLDSQQYFEKAQNNYGGHFNVSVNWLGSWASNRPPLNIVNNIEGSAVLVTPGLIGPDGQMGSRQYAPVPAWNVDYSFYVNKKVTDDNKLAKILQFVQYANFGEKKMDLMFGEPGVDYTLDADGMPVRSEAFAEQNDKGIQAYSLYIQDATTLDWINDALFRATADYSLGDGKWIQYLIKPYKYDLYKETDLVQVTADYASSIKTIVDEFAVGVITGETDLDAEWENYLANLNSAGYDKICAELDKAPLYADVISGN